MALRTPANAYTLQRIIYSQYAYSGLRVAIGVLGLGIAADLMLGLRVAAMVSAGALCASIADVPTPSRNTRLDMAAASVVSSLVYFAVASVHPDVWPTLVLVMAVSFLAGLLTSFGKEALPLSFILMFAAVIGLGSTPVPLDTRLEAASSMVCGGLAYSALALLAARVFDMRLRQQALAESLLQLARYIELKAGGFEPGTDVDDLYLALVRQLVVLVEKQQAARDVVLKDLRAGPRLKLAGVLIEYLDLYDIVLSSDTNYRILSAAAGEADVLMFFRDLTMKAAADIERVALSILRNENPPHPINYQAELLAIAYRLEGPDAAPLDTGLREVLDATLRRIQHAIVQIGRLHGVLRGTIAPPRVLNDIDLSRFVSRSSYSLRTLIGHINHQSAYFRHALRITFAMGTGYAVAQLLPHSTHSQWILLTIAVVMRSNFSQTRQRWNDRVAGSIVGCVLAAIILHLTQSAGLLAFAFFCALAVAHAFVTLRYRYTATAASVMALVQLHFLNQGGGFDVGERLIDTLIGAVIAYAFSFVFPRWERVALPALMGAALEAGQKYVRDVLQLGTSELDFRLARKDLFDTIARLASAYDRMLAEPREQHRAVAETSGLMTLCLRFAAQISAVRLLLRVRAEDLQDTEVEEQLRHAAMAISARLEAGRQCILNPSSTESLEAGLPVPPGTRVLDEADLRARLGQRLASLEELSSLINFACRAVAIRWRAI